MMLGYEEFKALGWSMTFSTRRKDGRWFMSVSKNRRQHYVIASDEATAFAELSAKIEGLTPGGKTGTLEALEVAVAGLTWAIQKLLPGEDL